MSWRRIAVALLFVVLVAVAMSAYALTQPKRYEATARVVVQPVSPANSTFTGIDLLRASGDTARDLGTAARFFDTPDVVSAAAARLSLSASALRRSLDVRPLAGSNVLLVVGKASNQQAAAQIANGIVQEAISQRTARVQAQISAILDKLSTSSSTEARRRAIDLLALQNRPDPTLETLNAATAPTRAAWPKPARMIGKAGLAALGLAALVLLLLSVAGAMRQRAAAVPVRDTELEDREVALARRAAAVDQREQELQQVVRDAQKASDVTTRETARIEARVAAVTTRERALAKQAAQLAQRERDLANRQAAFEELVAESERVPEPEPETEPEPRPASAPEGVVTDGNRAHSPVPGPIEVPRPGNWTVDLLERLVAERGDAFPDKVEEWRYYVVFLGEQAGPDGALPPSFDYLIEETFAELL